MRPSVATGIAASTSRNAMPRSMPAPRTHVTAARKSPVMASKFSMASRLLPRWIENAAESADTSTRTSMARVARASHTLRADKLFEYSNETAKSAVRPRMRNANWAHGTPAPQAQGVKPIAAASVINATRQEGVLPNGRTGPRSEVANQPSILGLASAKCALSADLLLKQYSSGGGQSQLKKLYTLCPATF